MNPLINPSPLTTTFKHFKASYAITAWKSAEMGLSSCQLKIHRYVKELPQNRVPGAVAQ
jgi:hypothetical protein